VITIVPFLAILATFCGRGQKIPSQPLRMATLIRSALAVLLRLSVARQRRSVNMRAHYAGRSRIGFGSKAIYMGFDSEERIEYSDPVRHNNVREAYCFAG
jgi:hypothetical protein